MVHHRASGDPVVERMRDHLEEMLSDRYSNKKLSVYTSGAAARFAVKVFRRAGVNLSEFCRLGKVGVSLFPHIEAEWIAHHGSPQPRTRPTKYLNWTRALFDQMRREGFLPMGKDCHGCRRHKAPRLQDRGVVKRDVVAEAIPVEEDLAWADDLDAIETFDWNV